MNAVNGEVVLVDEDDRVVGRLDKLAVHQEPKLHRAFSVFIFRSNGDMLLQRRAQGKYHSAGLWANACCSHPRPDHDTLLEAKKRLDAEIGITARLKHLGTVSYCLNVGGGLVEHELDHIYAGVSDGSPRLNPAEADAYKLLGWEDLQQELVAAPGHFAAWFCHIMDSFGDRLLDYRDQALKVLHEEARR